MALRAGVCVCVVRSICASGVGSCFSGIGVCVIVVWICCNPVRVDCKAW